MTRTAASDRQTTLARPAKIRGVGYWSGQQVEVDLLPATAGAGRYFVRADLPQSPPIPAVVANRREVPRRTVLGGEGAGVEMVEHALAALAGLGVDNCEIRVTAGEMPGCDGSAQPFVEAIRAGGVVELAEPAAVLGVEQVLRVGDDESWIEARPLADRFVVEYRLDYGADSPIVSQSVELEITPEAFAAELAASRTFLLAREAEWLQAQGLGLSASWKDLLVFGPTGPIQNQLRWPNECARHKALDLVGDLALAGFRLTGRFTAYRTGHKRNAELVAALLSAKSSTNRPAHVAAA